MKLAVDVGGTFTDLVLYDEATKATTIVKYPSTPSGFDDGVLRAVAMAQQDVDIGDAMFIHGSTVVINHLLERKGAKTALVTTSGFRDNLDIQRTNRPDLYQLRYKKPKPFVERADRFEVIERVAADGTILMPIDPEQVVGLAETLRERGYEAVAISFVNAYRNPIHEATCLEILQSLLPGVYFAVSSNIQLWREYERTNTTVCNAYVGPSVSQYLKRLSQGLTNMGVQGQYEPTMMLSGGGRTTFDEAQVWPINLVESGPAAGVTGACVVAQGANIRDFIALDVGGTTAKAALVENGQPQMLQEYVLEPGRNQAGYPLLVPSIDIVEIGAGGGSIVRLTEDGALRIGPDSVGAHPGPACYGRGGTLPSITDANLLAGRLPSMLASGLELDRDSAVRAFEPIVTKLNLSLEEVIRGVLRLAESRMSRVLHLATVARGKDPRAYQLLAYGGSAPLHAAEMAKELRIGSVVVPPNAGVFAAWGMVHAQYIVDLMKTLWVPWPSGREEVETTFVSMRDEARSRLRSMGRLLGKTDLVLEVRYEGQARSLAIPVKDFASLESTFVRAHHEKYGFTMSSPIEVTSIHVRASDAEADESSVQFDRVKVADGAAVTERSAEHLATRKVLFAAGWTEAKVYDRERLHPGDIILGPAIIEESTTTTVVPPQANLRVDEQMNLVISFGG